MCKEWILLYLIKEEIEVKVIFETVFDLTYLIGGLILGIRILSKSKPGSNSRLFAYMTLILVFGDMFHLVPRIYGFYFGLTENVMIAQGYGKMVTSITMTFFYIILYVFWRKRYYISGKRHYTVMMILLSVSRILLCVNPSNQWTLANTAYEWGIYRNIPFMLIGILMIYIFYSTRNKLENDSLRNMWLAILLSFFFYLPVILFVDFIPAVGMLMIPKTIAYVWMIFMGYQALRDDFSNM